MKLSELLLQDQIELQPGSYLVATTRSEGFVGSRSETGSIARGRHMYKVVVGGNGVTYIAPMVAKKDLSGYEEDLANPIVMLSSAGLTYITGRNHPTAKDGYNSYQYFTKKDVQEGQENRNLIMAFLSFANTEYSLGVNDFMIEPPELIEGEQEPEEPGDGDTP